MLDLSISIVNWNTKDLLRGCLKSIYENTHKIDFEIFVVDNASSDGSAEMVEEEFPQVKLIKNNKNLGFAKANNKALKETTGKYILLLNPDTVILGGALDIMVEFMEEHKDIGALGPKLINRDGTLQPSCRSFPTLATAFFENTFLDRLFPRNRIIGRYKMGYWDHDNIREVDQPIGACLMVKQEAINQIGLLDEQFYMYYEEVDLCYRMKKIGWRIYFLPQAQVIHYGGQSSAVANLQILVERQRSMYNFYRKHYQKNLLLNLLKCITMIGALLRMVIFFSLYLFSKKRCDERKLRGKGYWEVVRKGWRL